MLNIGTAQIINNGTTLVCCPPVLLCGKENNNNKIANEYSFYSTPRLEDYQ